MDALEAVNPEERVDRDESISLAFLVLLEQLQPIERAVFLLREVFDSDRGESGETCTSIMGCRLAEALIYTDEGLFAALK